MKDENVLIVAIRKESIIKRFKTRIKKKNIYIYVPVHITPNITKNSNGLYIFIFSCLEFNFKKYLLSNNFSGI